MNLIFNKDNKVNIVYPGLVIKIKDGIATIKGLFKVKSGEILEFSNGLKGLALNLSFSEINCVIFGNERFITEGTRVKSTGDLMTVKASINLLGRVINVLGETIDKDKNLNLNNSSSALEFKNLSVEQKAVGIISRQSVNEPMLTGIKAIDSLIPIGRGQRELIIGDRQTGKTSIAIDTIMNQLLYNENYDFKNYNLYCIYVAIGQKKSTAARIFEFLKAFQSNKFSIIVSAFASESASLQYLAPYVGTSLGEYLRDNNKHCVIIYDDLTKHAAAYRQMSLLLRRPPGREAYPGDVFYLHSRLLERSAKLSNALGSGSLTGLPVIETLEGDVSAYIPTNVISITDGQIFLDTDQFYSGIRPAVNVGLSVSRVGGAAQPRLMKMISGSLKVGLAQFREVESFASLGCDIDPVTQQLLDRGYRLIQLFIQNKFDNFSLDYTILAVFAGSKGFLDNVSIKDIEKKINSIFKITKKKIWTPFFIFLKMFSYPDKEGINLKDIEKFLNNFNKLN